MFSETRLSGFRQIRWYRPNTLLGLAVFLFAPLAAFIPLSLAVLLPVMALLVIASRILSATPSIRIHKLSTTVLILLLLVAAASTGWSHSSDLSWDKLPRTAMIGLLGILFIGAMAGFGTTQTRNLSKLFLSSVILVIAIIIVERIVGGIFVRDVTGDFTFNHFLNTFNRPLSLMSILLWPAVVYLCDRHAAYGVAAVVVFFAAFSTFQTGAATVSVAFGALIFGVVYMAPRIMAPLTGIVLGISVLLAPTINQMLPSPKEMFEQYDLPRSAYHRLLIWDFTSAKIAERPLLGWGFNTSRGIPEGKKNLDASEAALPLHPHNAALQWRLELGIPGAILGAGLFVVAGLSSARYGRSRVAQAGATAAMASAFTIAMLSFGAWQSWWLSGLFIVTGITVLVCRDPETSAS